MKKIQWRHKAPKEGIHIIDSRQTLSEPSINKPSTLTNISLLPYTIYKFKQNFLLASGAIGADCECCCQRGFASKKMSGMESEVRVWEREEQNDAVRCCATTSGNNEAGHSAWSVSAASSTKRLVASSRSFCRTWFAILLLTPSMPRGRRLLRQWIWFMLMEEPCMKLRLGFFLSYFLIMFIDFDLAIKWNYCLSLL